MRVVCQYQILGVLTNKWGGDVNNSIDCKWEAMMLAHNDVFVWRTET